MRLIDFVTHLLKAQAHSLQRLAAFFGEDELLHILETAGDLPGYSDTSSPILKEWFRLPHPTKKGTSYVELEGAVHDLKLPSVLEFHLWAYPFYRSIIESSIDLNSEIIVSTLNHESPLDMLIHEATLHARRWIHKLPISPEISPAAESAAMVPWIRFRTELLKKVGKSPFTAVKNFS